MSRDNLVRWPLGPQTPVSPEREREEAVEAAAAASPGGRARAYAREAAAADESAQLAKLARYYCAAFGRRHCPPSILRVMRDAMAAGMAAKVVAMAMDAAAEAPQPSWAYAAAVIRGCLADGALTPEGFEARSVKHRQRRNQGKSMSNAWNFPQSVPNALNFPQRTYTEEDLAHLFVDLGRYMDEK